MDLCTEETQEVIGDEKYKALFLNMFIDLFTFFKSKKYFTMIFALKIALDSDMA